MQIVSTCSLIRINIRSRVKINGKIRVRIRLSVPGYITCHLIKFENSVLRLISMKERSLKRSDVDLVGFSATTRLVVFHRSL